MAAKKSKGLSGSYGIAEWYGRLYRNLSTEERTNFLNPKERPECPFVKAVPALAPKSGFKCNKIGGVCSIRSFKSSEESGVEFGPITATCPNRFLEGGEIVRAIGAALIDTQDPILVKEVAFLQRLPGSPEIFGKGDEESEDENADPANIREDVGKIDIVFVNPGDKPLKWCAVELQAVYFSGGAMSKDFAAIRQYVGNSLPMPGAGRRPDFRSSGPKRLMPQLQIKVPTLRRWGKKMAVVVDRAFFEALGPMERVAHVSNSDIAWVVVDYIESALGGNASLVVRDIIYTTLERAVEGLTAGNPSDLPAFEERISKKLKTPK